MGWTTTHKQKGQSILDFFKTHGVMTWPEDSPNTYKVLDSAVIRLRTFYAALEIIDKATGERRVTALVILLGFYKGHENFGWKDMDESMGPNEAECPERILDLLTPIDSEYANNWRKRCRDAIAYKKAKPKIEVGCTLNLYGKPYTVTANLGRKGFHIYSYEEDRKYRMTIAKARLATDIVPKVAS